MLGHDALRINDLVIDGVAQRLGQRVVNNLKRAALVMATQVLHILQHKGGRLVVIDDRLKVKEEVALLLIVKAGGTAKTLLFGNAGNAERLAGKSRAQDVVRGNLRHCHGMDVALRFLGKIGGVGLARILVPIRGENALSPGPLKRQPEAADAAEEVDETKRGCSGAL